MPTLEKRCNYCGNELPKKVEAPMIVIMGDDKPTKYFCSTDHYKKYEPCMDKYGYYTRIKSELRDR